MVELWFAIIALMLTLYVVPAVYVIFDRALARIRGREVTRRRTLAAAEAE